MWLHLRHLALIALVASAPGFAVAADDWQAQVGAALGKTGATAPGGIYRVGLPRTDLKVTLDGVELKAGFALGGWLAFEKMGDQGMVMGDLVLTMDEVAPVMTKLAASGSPCQLQWCEQWQQELLAAVEAADIERCTDLHLVLIAWERTELSPGPTIEVDEFLRSLD